MAGDEICGDEGESESDTEFGALMESVKFSFVGGAEFFFFVGW